MSLMSLNSMKITYSHIIDFQYYKNVLLGVVLDYSYLSDFQARVHLTVRK